MGIDNRSRANPVGVAPDRRTGTRAGPAENALCSLIVARALLWRLQSLGSRLVIIGNQVGLDRFVLLKEAVHVDDQVFDDRVTEHRLNRHLLAHVAHENLAGEAVAPVDAHGIGAADAVRARTPVRQRAIHRPLDDIERVQQAINRIGLDGVLGPVWLRVLLWIEAFDTHL